MSAYRFGLLATACLCGWIAPSAHAQTTSVQTDTVLTDAQDAERPNIEVVIVTARKREERLDDVPVSITVFDQGFLEAMDVGTGKDLTRITPGAYVIDNGSGFNDEFLIRGEGSARQNNAETGVGLYRNGVFIAGGNAGGRNFVPIDFFDVGSVTVLRGPQGSFYGRNALGGAVDILSQRPTDRREGEAQISVGTNDNLAGELIANLPVTDTFFVRVGGFAADQSDGFYTSSINGQVLDIEDSTGWRAQASWRPSAAFDINLLLESSDEFGPNVVAFGQVLALNDPPINPAGAPSGFAVSRFLKPVDTPSFFERTTRMNVLEWNWDLGFAVLKSTTAERSRSAATQSDVDVFGNNNLARAVPTVALGTETFDRLTQDLRLVSASDGAVTWLVGFEYNKVDSVFNTTRFADAVRNNQFNGLSDVPATLSAACQIAPTCTLAQVQTQARNAYRVENSGVDDTSVAGYAATTWRLNEALQVSADIRWSQDEKSFRLDNQFRLDNPATAVNEQLTRSIKANRTFTKWTPSVSFNWRYADSHVLFGRIGTGFRAGGFNNDLGEIGDGVSSIAIPLAYGEEFVTAYELGTRGRLGRAFRYDISGFFNQKQNVLVNYSVFAGTSATNTLRNVGVLAAAGDSIQYGLDLQLAGRFTIAGGVLSPQVNVSWANGEYDGGAVYANTQANPAGTLALVSIDGKNIQRLREWTTASSVQYRRPIVGGFDLVLMLSQRQELGGFEDPSNNNLMDDVVLYDGSIGVQSARWRLTFSGKNITDEVYFNISPGNQAFIAQQNEPRTWRATLAVTL
jgi:iron complex outermembrane receptor protein